MISDYNQTKTLKTIAEVLNQSYERESMLQTVLDSFLDITHFEAGWIFLGDGPDMTLAADSGLPEALLVDDKAPMCGSDSCYCLSKYRQQRLNEAINIMTCKRLEEAIQESKFDTGGFTHHATVPIISENKRYGVFNVSAPHRDQFEESELELLQSIALQVTHALKRIDLFELEEKRNNNLQTLHKLSTAMRSIDYLPDLENYINQDLVGKLHISGIEINSQSIQCLYGNRTEHLFEYKINQLNGEIFIYSDQLLSSVEKEIYTLLGQNIELTLKDISIKRREREIIQLQEREMLAQELHDTVNQLLYSMTATSSALKVMNDNKELNEPIDDLNQLASQALKEMRELIENKKSQVLEQGLLRALDDYAKQLNIELNTNAKGSSNIPPYIEENLYKIGREALHNIYKHANTQKANVELIREYDEIKFSITDQGAGFNMETNSNNYGISGMQDRVYNLNGHIQIESSKGDGVSITISIPIKRR
ncbi:GAF domain-containing sensor histidine kinase [Filobacillus milosensis]|uniref:histidine kinase n=1 Tax=Filobacillus milosensis TaxID=94137 RepID=A0A4Y8ILF8_9BACI|nr:GAF domain-containing sensor histidine kinase [Filobacillus milosensis]TFB22139.1 GAF domain-containing sensor histidine kinase [Filobacillus milosensis]